MDKIIIQYRGDVSIYTALPPINNVLGDVRLVTASGIQYFWSLNIGIGTTADWIPINDQETVGTGGSGGGDGIDEEARRRSWFGI